MFILIFDDEGRLVKNIVSNHCNPDIEEVVDSVIDALDGLAEVND